MWSHYLIFSIDYSGFAYNSGTCWNPAGCQSTQLYQGKIATWLYVYLETQCSVNVCVCILFVLCLEKDKWLWNRTKESIQGGNVEKLTFMAFNEYTLLLHSGSRVLSKLYLRQGRQNTLHSSPTGSLSPHCGLVSPCFLDEILGRF